MYHEYTQEELRQYCRNNIESLEIWARRLIHEKMVEKYGENYVSKQFEDGNYLVNSEIRKHIQGMIENEPIRFHRAVDTLFIEQIIYFLCHPIWYKDLFKTALDYIYPQGKEEAREFLSRLVPIRNPLSHSNPITMHDAERAICYSHDFVEGLKKYYKDRGEEQVWNVPRIMKITDSFGNVFDNIDDKGHHYTIHNIPQTVRCGDTYTVWIEVDSSFLPNEYDVKWRTDKDLSENDNKFQLTYQFTTQDVSENMYIRCKIISHKEWHKHQSYDSEIYLHFQVLPPIE